MLLANKRIFMVEDNLNNKAITELLLEREGACIAADRWGVGVIDRLRRFAPLDIILMDLMLPREISGYDIFQQIRQLTEFNHVPVVALSAADVSTAIPKAQTMGFTGFISKPIDFLLFPHQIRWIIDGKAVWATEQL
jgi:two-component system, chemotaxis family, sensor kinase CheA